MVTLINLLSTTYAPVQIMMLPYLGVAEVLALTRTCKGFGQLLPVLKATAWNIDHHLKQFFSDPLEFRSIQGECNALIYGEFARGFFRRTVAKATHLDIALDFSDDYLLAKYLCGNGYTDKGAIFEKEDNDGDTVTIYLHLFEDRAAIAEVIGLASTTADLNVISWNKAYSLFPYTTLIKEECYLLKELTDQLAQHLAALTKDGLKTKSISWDRRRGGVGLRNYAETGCTDKLSRRRRIGDKHTWVQKLSVRGVEEPHIPDSILETTTYRLRLPRSGQEELVPRYVLDYDETLRHPVLEFPYVTLKEDGNLDGGVELDEYEQRLRTSYYSQKCDELKDRLDELTVMELAKIPAEDRPRIYPSVVSGFGYAKDLRGCFHIPSTWTYYDDDVRAYLAEAWKDQLEHDEKEEAEKAKCRPREVARVRIDG